MALENTSISGAYVVNIGKGGMELSSWVNVAGSKALSNLATLVANEKPDLFTLEMKEPYTSTYDGTAGITQTLIRTLKNAYTATDYVLVGSTPTSGGYSDDGDAGVKGFSKSLQVASTTLGCYYFDTYNYFQGGTSPYTQLSTIGWQGDGVHRATQADQYFAGILMRDMGIDSYVNANGTYSKFAGNIFASNRIDVSADYANPNLSLLADNTFKLDGYIKSKRWVRFQTGGGVDVMQLDLTSNVYHVLPDGAAIGPSGARLKAVSGTQLAIRQNGATATSADFSARNITKVVSTTASASGALTLDFSASSRINVTLTENVTSISVIAPPANTENLVVRFIQDATGGRTVAGWPASFKFEGGSAPSITTTAGKSDIYRFFFDNSSVSYLQDGKSVGL